MWRCVLRQIHINVWNASIFGVHDFTSQSARARLERLPVNIRHMSLSLAVLPRGTTTEPHAREPDHFIDNSLCCCTCRAGRGQPDAPLPRQLTVMWSVDSAQTYRLGTSPICASFHHICSCNAVRHIIKRYKTGSLDGSVGKVIEWAGFVAGTGVRCLVLHCLMNWDTTGLFLSTNLAPYSALRPRMPGYMLLSPHTSSLCGT